MEKVMVVDKDIILRQFGVDVDGLILSDEHTFLDAVQGNCTFLGRDVVETDPSFKQIISYCVIMSGSDIFVTRRTKRQTEARLHDRMSVGIGGHVASVDEGADMVLRGLRRELEEEVAISGDYTMRYLGVINDDSTEVGRVHTGICYLVRVAHGDCVVREQDKMVGQWVPFADVGVYYANFEEWSKIVVNTLTAHPELLEA
jgi:predicted NUDIX family phosphoesterase